ncbi:hypothetical protein SUGI_0483490 [Cryptomeria japonica]|uniref:uncharacterized protein LOC131031069 isoform X2 n=1 Tax=Cryptomeria japonica TaxID=3369 RepID=UPI002408CBA8|nr:uncharacterized protein LOC131031069 isoform X2 [Cryptomeria japonica]GLJ25256.1 hypothetical protein SUGI_0483490 [Cryptomeria japonica]
MGDLRNLGLHESAGSDTEDLLVTSMNARQLENCLGAAIVWREVDVRGQEARQATNVGFPYQCYSSPDNDDEYPLLIHTRHTLDGYGSYQEPFVNGSSFYHQPAVEVSGGEVLKFQPGVKEFGLNVDSDIFESSLSNDGREDEVCDGRSPEKNGIPVECPGEEISEDSKCGKISGEKYGSLKECPNDQMANAASLEDIEIRGECKNDIASEIHKDYLNEKAVEDNVCFETSSGKYDSPKECPNYLVVNAGTVEVKFTEECAKKTDRECVPCNGEIFLPAQTEVGQDSDMICTDTGEMDAIALETNVYNSEQQVPLEIYVKPKGRKSSRRKKATGSRKRISRKISSQKVESIDPSADGTVDLLDSNNSEGQDALTTPQIAAIDTPLQSSSVVSSTEETYDGTNEVAKNLLANSKNIDRDTGLYANNNFADGIIGRITRSRAHGKVCTRTLIHDSLLDKRNPIFASKMTGKRSVLGKTIRSTAWGGLENLREGVGLKKTEIASKSELSCLDTEFGVRKIIGDVIHIQQVTKRGCGVRWQGPETNLEHHQSDHVKSPTVGRCRNFTKEKNDEPEREGLQGSGFVLEFRGSDEDILNARRGELSNFNEDIHSGGETSTEKDIGEEQKCSGIEIDRCSTDQPKCYLRREVPRSLGYVEKKSTCHGDLSELGRTNIEVDAPHGDGWPADVIDRDRSSTDQLKCYLPHEATESLRKVEEHNASHEHLNESFETNIEAVVHQNYRGKPRGGGVKRQKPRRIIGSGQSRQTKCLVDDGSKNCQKKSNEKQQKGFLQDQCFVIESSASEDHILNVQEGDFLCSSRDLPYGAGIGREENTKQEQESVAFEKDRLSDVLKPSGRVEEKNKGDGHSNELCITNIEDEKAQNKQWGKRGIGIERHQPGKVWDNTQLEHVKYPVFGSGRHGSKRRNNREGKVVIYNSDSIVENRGSDENGSSVQESDFLCFNGDLHSGGGIGGQKIIDEEHDCLKSERDQCPIDKSKWHLPCDSPKSSIKVEEKNLTQRHSSEETICTFINEAKSHDSSSIKMDASQEVCEESTHHICDVRQKKKIVSCEQLAAISVQVGSSLKQPEECRTNTQAIVGTVLEMEKSDANMGLEPAFAQGVPVSLRNLQYRKYIEQENALLDIKEGSLEPSTVMLQDETRSYHNEIVTTNIDLKGCGLSGMRMEVADPLTTEHRDNDLHDTVSATSHGNITKTFAKQEPGKRKGNVKEKFKSKPRLSTTGLGVAEVTLGGLNLSQDEQTVRKVTKSRCKKTVIRARTQGRKSNLKNRRSLLYRDGNDQVVVDEGVLPREAERNSNCEIQETFNGEGMQTCVREESIVSAKIETLAPRGKGQERKNLKNCRRGNIKTESMCSSVMCESKRKATRQTNNNSEKKLLRGKSRQVCNGLQSSTKSNGKPGKGLDSLLSKNGFSNQETSQGKAVSADLSGMKGQSDSCTDAASSLKLADTSTNEEDKHGFSSCNHDSEDKNAIETYFPERQGIAGCNNEAAGEDVSSNVNKGEANRTLNMIKYDGSVERGCGSPRVGWVACDDCQKWRCIAVELIDAIRETNCKWTCQDNPNKEFADCSIPQEKSNAEINADLNISDVSCEEGDCTGAPGISKYSASMQARDPHQAFWTLIKHNRILHRSRKTQAIDEIMVCHCKPPEDGSYGCGDECLNRMLNIECVKEACPCGDLCSNQQFQKRLYAEVKLLRCGRKGFGLQVLQEVTKGLFIIEYVGEVLDMQAYNARQKEYALRGQRHFYFMTLDSNEVIDACVKGNLGRFINHSCDPNCRTEKWMVNGEVCIGLFAIRDIKKGEELTFDYNYVRVFGAAAKKCECSSSECKGFIGGDQSTPAIVVPSEPDDDYPVPVMLNEESENDNAQKNLVRSPKVHSLSDSFVPEGRSLQRTERKGQWTSDQHEKQVEVSSNRDMDRLVGVTAIGNITNMKKSMTQTNLGRFEGVEEKLNEMLDSEGGISKRKDAAKHYLKLLLVTAASGNTSNGEACHSTRDLSMVLDALLKTRSRSVLIDIMNKNGLQMLHNMLKQNRNDFSKTPIIRKLLKVLEFLGTKDVLTIENINSDPLCRGRESLRASICALTGHSDWQVQQIARSFRDNWMPHPIKILRSNERSIPSESGITVSDHPNNRSKFTAKRQKNFFPRDTDAIDCTSQISPEPENSAWRPVTRSDEHEVSHDSHDNFPVQDSTKKLSEEHISGQMKGMRPRKRKSRWDQPVESNVHQVFSQTTLASEEGKVKQGKESDSLISPSERANTPGARQDALTKGFRLPSEEKSVTIADKNVPFTDPMCQSAPPSHQDMPMLNGSNTLVKEQSSFQSAMQQATQLPGHSHFCLGSKSTPLCPTVMPSAQPFTMGHPQGKVVLGFAVGKSHGCILPHMPLSYGIPLSLLEQLGRTPNAKVGSVVQPLSPPTLHCEWNSNSVAAPMLPNISYRPFIGQSVVGGFPHTLHHQMRPSNMPLAMQAAHLLQSGRRQPLEMHPRELLGQHISVNPGYVQSEPPVPGLSPRVSSVNPQNNNRPGRGRNKTTHGQMLKPLKRQWKNPKSNFRTFSKFNGNSDRKYKDCFHPRKPLSFKSTWKGRFSSHLHADQNLQHLPNGNILDLKNEQQKLENMNSANFSKGVSNNFPTFN